MWLKISEPTTVPTPNVEWSTKRAMNDVNISGDEAPAAMKVAPMWSQRIHVNLAV
jgi:LEA14-like dessication related protein